MDHHAIAAIVLRAFAWMYLAGCTWLTICWAGSMVLVGARTSERGEAAAKTIDGDAHALQPSNGREGCAS